MSIAAAIRGLKADRRGSTIIEFAIVAPVLCLFMVGFVDIAHTLYVQSVLEGEIQKAGRDSALETGITRNTGGALDARIERQVHQLVAGATFSATRRYYRTFTDANVADPEDTTDTNSDGQCNNNEPYFDVNHNNTWDRDGADDGQGGAKDKVVYTVVISYPRVVPLYNWLNISNTVELRASTVLANQPYGDQSTYAAGEWKNCA